MGNNADKNDNFKNNPNFNFEQHRQVMQNISGNYAPIDLTMNANITTRPTIDQKQFIKIKRTCSIYKPSINIRKLDDSFLIEFDYDCDQNTLLQIYVGVTDVAQTVDTHLTLNIQSKLYFQDFIVPAKKGKYSKKYQLNGFSGLESTSFILKIVNKQVDQSTQYSLRKIRNPQHWKVLLQKLQLKGHAIQLQNIYKSQDGNECIICLTQKADTLIQPCNHLCLCNGCKDSVRASTNKCPICRNPITNFKKMVAAQ